MTSEPTPKLLVVEDEKHLAAGLKLNFELEGFRVDICETARQAVQQLVEGAPYDVIVLDVMLPDLDGFELCRRIRNSGNVTPIIMLTARGEPGDRVQGLNAGADDYIAKPFELSELLARVHSALRRRLWDKTHARAVPSRLAFDGVEVDFATHEVRVNGKPVALTQLELDLLRYFADHPNRVLSREELLEEVWKLGGSYNTRTVDNFIVRLRRHFEQDPRKPRYFVAVRGSGYKFVPPQRA